MIIFVQYAGNRGGSAISGELILRAMVREHWQVHSIFGFLGTYSDVYRKYGEVSAVPHQWIGARTLKRALGKLFDSAVATFSFYRLFRKQRPSLVYVNTLVSVQAAVAAKLAGVPLVWHVREMFEDESGELILPLLGGKSLIRFLLRILPDHVVLISEAVRHNVFGDVVNENMSIVPNAIPDEYMQISAPRASAEMAINVPKNRVTIGVPGTLREVKGQDFLLLSLSNLLKSREDVVVLITGDTRTHFFGRLSQLVEDCELTDKVAFLGDLEDMRGFYQSCDLICVPSRSETFGRTVIEAFISGVPVVATAVGGIKEIVEDGVTGLLVNFGDKEALMLAVERLLESPQLRKQLASAAKDEAYREYTETVYAQRICKIIADTAMRGQKEK